MTSKNRPISGVDGGADRVGVASTDAPRWGPHRTVTAGWTEHQVQAAVISWAKQMQRRWPELWGLHAIPNGGGFRGGFNAQAGIVAWLRAEGMKSGVPDLCLPVARGGYHGLYLETKRVEVKRTKTLGLRERRTDAKPEQDQWRDFLRSQGYRVERYWTPEEGQRLLEAYMTGALQVGDVAA